ncbi:unnamed protein product, partial [Arabidopsis halleri]
LSWFRSRGLVWFKLKFVFRTGTKREAISMRFSESIFTILMLFSGFLELCDWSRDK